MDITHAHILAAPLLLLACVVEEPRDTGEEIVPKPRLDTYAGQEVLLLGASDREDSGQLYCALVWEVAGAAPAEHLTEEELCPACLFVFDLDLTYDAAGSWHDGTCEAYARSFSRRVGLWESYTEAYDALVAWEDGAWVPLAPATIGDEGELDYSNVVYDAYAGGLYWTRGVRGAGVAW